MRDVTIICRLTSRHGTAYYQRLVDELPKRGVRIVESHMVRKRKELKRRIRCAIKGGRRYIVVIGGDGTQTAAVSEMAHTDAVLAVVPAGTGNSFALSLGISASVDDAIETIASGKEIKVDAGIVNGTYFANFSTIGVMAEAAKNTNKPLKRVVGPIAYGLAAIAPIFRHQAFEMRIKWPGNTLRIKTHQAIIASGRYFGWQPLTPNAGVRTGELSFFAAEGTSPRDVLETNAALLLGNQTHMENAHFFSAPKISIKTKPKQQLNIDGHALGKTPAKFKIAPKALRVLVPRDFRERE